MRVAIVTLTHVYNFGNSLQNYAVQHTLHKLGLAPETIIIDDIPFRRKIKRKICSLLKQTYADKRKKEFDRFEKKYIWYSPFKNVTKRNIWAERRYSYYIVGSDQVWNPSWYDKNRQNAFLLTFTSNEKKVCFSPSFGVDTIPEPWREQFKKYLKTFPKISVREESGAKIVMELTGKKAEVLLDPTLMLDVEEWLMIASKPQNVECGIKYVFTYFLGGIDEERKKVIEEIALKYGLKIYDILDDSNPYLYMIGPREFIYLLYHATLIMTDSFHACSFSFLFNKPFLVYARSGAENDMMDRVHTLLKKFSMERKYVGSGLKNDHLESDYRIGHKILNGEREKVMFFLRDSMRL